MAIYQAISVNRREPLIFCMNGSFVVLSTQKKYRNRIAGISYHGYIRKFSSILKLFFSQKAKLILSIISHPYILIRLRCYLCKLCERGTFMSLTHKYFNSFTDIPSYYDQSSAGRQKFEDKVKIIEAHNPRSEDMHKQLFFYVSYF